MGLERVTLRFSFALVIISTVLMSCATSDSDQNECTPQLVGLATCLPYVGGTAKSPTPDCCNGLKQVLKTNKKCLCVVVKDRNDPNLGLSINATLALGLPSVCHAPANISQCPELLHLAPNSPDAQVFYQFSHGSSIAASSPISSAKANTTSANSTTGTTPSTPKESKGIRKRWVDLNVIVGGGVLFWSFTSNLFI